MKDLSDSVAFLNGTYEEALKLAHEARDYLSYQESKDRAQLDTRAQLVASCETMRLTARLTQVIAWLMVQRAVQSGEMSRAQAAEAQFRLSGREVCAEDNRLEALPLPARLEELLDRSHTLYQRVERLDAMMDSVAS